MENIVSLENETRNEIVLVSNPGVFPLTVLELLMSSYLRVSVVTENIRGWENISEHLKDNKNIKLFDIKERNDYLIREVIFLDDGIIKKEEGTLLDNFFKILKTEGLFKEAKCSFYFNFNDREIKNVNRLINIVRNSKTIYFKDIFGPGLVEKGVSVPTDLLIDAIRNGGIILPKNEYIIKPLFINLAAREVVRNLLTGLQDKYETLSGEEMSVKEFSFKILKMIDGCSLKVGDYEVEKIKDGEAKELKDEYIDEKIRITLEWYKQKLECTETSPKNERNSGKFIKNIKNIPQRFLNYIYRIEDGFIGFKTKTKKALQSSLMRVSLVVNIFKNAFRFIEKVLLKSGGRKILKVISSKKFKKIGQIVTLFFLTILLPVIMLVVSIACVLFAQKVIKMGDRGLANKFLKVGTFTSGISKNTFTVYSKLPGIGGYYLYMRSIAEDIDHVARVGTTLTDISITAMNMSKKMLGEKEYSVTEYSKEINVGIDKLYREASFFEGDIKTQKVWHFKEAAKILKEFDIEEKRNKLFGLKKIIESLPSILSEKGEKNYLLLFQNNMELRPTGGFIGSFAIVKFKNGKLNDLNVMDVYSADGQLKGHVEPPAPIKKYLNQANWYLRDSNWDPDFVVSAQRAEWFVGKEMDINVDGVISMDLNFIKDIVSVTGPVEIKDYDRVVNKDNLYEIVQYEAEKDFFPGSQKKASFLTALSKELILNFSEGKIKDLLGLSTAFYSNLEEGHIQMYFHDEKAQKGVSDLGWSGKVEPPVCDKDNCYSDWFGVVEANLGVNKANYFVERSMSFSSYVDRRIVKRKVEVNLKSTANPILDKRGTYGVYIRVIAPENAEFEDVRIVSKGEEKIIRPDVEYIKNRVEAGVFVETLPSTGINITFSWKNLINVDFSNKGTYMFHWRKQPGTDSDKIKIEVNLPKGLTIKPSLDPSLTGTGVMGYNLSLPKDINMLFDW